MKTERKRTPAQWAVLLLIWCGPTLLLWLLTIPDALRAPEWPTGMALFMMAQIGLIVTRLIFLFRSSHSVGGKIWRTVFWVIVIIFIGLNSIIVLPHVFYNHTSEDAQSKFEAKSEEFYEPEMFPLELGAPLSVTLHTYDIEWGIFSYESCTLLCRYEEEDYGEKKAALEERYSFRTEPMSNGQYPAKDIEPYVNIGDDFFRVLQGSRYPFYESCALIVTNDTEHEIGYILYYDDDRDWAEDLTSFLLDDCGWKYIRKDT